MTTSPPSAALRQTAPVDPSWPKQHIEPHRNRLLEQIDAAERRLDEADQRYEQVDEAGAKELDELATKIPDVGDNPTEVEWLTRRAAQADRDLAATKHALELQELAVDRQRLLLEVEQMSWRVAQLDDLLESGAYAAGNAALMAVIDLDVQEAAARLAHETAVLEIARQRVTHAKRMHRDIHQALRRLKRSARGASA